MYSLDGIYLIDSILKVPVCDPPRLPGRFLHLALSAGGFQEHMGGPERNPNNPREKKGASL